MPKKQSKQSTGIQRSCQVSLNLEQLVTHDTKHTMNSVKTNRKRVGSSQTLDKSTKIPIDLVITTDHSSRAINGQLNGRTLT